MIRGKWRFVRRIRQPGGDLYLFQYMGEAVRPFHHIPVDYFWGKKPAAGGKG
jgi:hypothetical protein